MLIVVNIRLHTFLCRLGNEHCNHLFAECMQFSAPFLGQIRGIELSATPKTNNMPKNVSCQSVQPPIFVRCPSFHGVFRGERTDTFFFLAGLRWHDMALPTMNRGSHTISIFSGLKSYAPAMMASMGLWVGFQSWKGPGRVWGLGH